MAQDHIIHESPISMFDLKNELSKIKKRDKELNFRAKRTEEYLNQVATEKKLDELFVKIEKLKIPRLKEAQIKKIVDILPTTEKDLKVVLQGYTLSINQENSKKVVNAINKFLKK